MRIAILRSAGFSFRSWVGVSTSVEGFGLLVLGEVQLLGEDFVLEVAHLGERFLSLGGVHALCAGGERCAGQEDGC